MHTPLQMRACKRVSMEPLMSCSLTASDEVASAESTFSPHSCDSCVAWHAQVPWLDAPDSCFGGCWAWVKALEQWRHSAAHLVGGDHEGGDS